MEQKNVYTKPYKLDVAIGTALILISMGILAEFSQSHRNIKPGLALLFFKVSRGFGWAVSTLSRQSYIAKLFELAKITVILFIIVLCFARLQS